MFLVIPSQNVPWIVVYKKLSVFLFALLGLLLCVATIIIIYFGPCETVICVRHVYQSVIFG